MICDGTAPIVSVIIPTMASSQRGPLLKRAVESIRASSVKSVRIIAVVNGLRFDAVVCDWLKAQPDIQFEYVATPSAPGAILKGRELVQTEYFSTLDDDDEYLQGTLDSRLAFFQANTHASLLVANGFRSIGGIDRLLYEGLPAASENPLNSLMHFNWLNSCNALYRSSKVDSSFFANYHDYAEWTWLAYRLSLAGKRVLVWNFPAFRLNDTVGSLSKTSAYSQAYIPLFRRMLALAPPKHIVKLIHRKIAAAYHDASVAALQDGRRKDAWRDHLHSVTKPGGFKYLSYTRHLFN